LSPYSGGPEGSDSSVFKEPVPRLGHSVIFGTWTEPVKAQSLKEDEIASAAFGVHLEYSSCLRLPGAIVENLGSLVLIIVACPLFVHDICRCPIKTPPTQAG
jgi:hypothetical protein